jgi:hypothetical protein
MGYKIEKSAKIALVVLTSFTTVSIANWGGPEGNYIIITHPDFENVLTNEDYGIAYIKNNDGYTVVLKTTNWIYANYPRPAGNEYLSIKDFITDAYENWTMRPEYVLLVGDAELAIDYSYTLLKIPVYFLDADFPTLGYSDDLFVCVEGDDTIPDLAIGRLPARTSLEVLYYSSKLDYYESKPPSEWESEFVFSINDLETPAGGHDDWHNILYGQSDEAFNLLERFGMTGSEYRRLDFNSDDDMFDAYSSVINSGTSLALTNGVSAYFRIDSCLDAYRVPDLVNFSKYPLFINPSCYTGAFAASENYSDNICEKLLFTDNRGGIAAFGHTKNSGILNNWEICKRVLSEITMGSEDTLGKAIVSAKTGIINNNPGLTDYVNRYIFFGDPALELNAPIDFYPPVLTGWPIYLNNVVRNPAVSTELPLTWSDPMEPPPGDNNSGAVSNDSPLCGSWAESDTPYVIASSEGFTKAYYSTTQEVFDLYSSGVMGIPVSADIDADGEMDTVIISGFDSSCAVYLINESGTYKAGFPVILADSCSYAPAVGDIDSDGYLDIIVATETKLHAIDHEGDKQVLANFNDIYQGNVAAGSPVIGDIDQDGDLEIVMSLHLYPQEYSYLVVYEKDGDIADGWPILLPTELVTAPALADINGEPGDIEIVVGSVNNQSGGGPENRIGTREDWDNGQCRIFEYDGTYITSGPTMGTAYELPPVVANVLGGSAPEILLVNEQYGARVDVYNSNCVRIDEFSYGGIPTSAPTVADVDGDTVNEVIMGKEGELKKIYDPGLTSQWNCPLYGDVSTPAVCDLDDDGSVDIVCGDGEAVYAFTTEGPYDSDHLNEEWSKSGHDNMNTGLWDLLAPTNLTAEDVPDDEGGAIMLTWTPSLDAGVRSSRSAGYQVWRSASEGIVPPPGPLSETGRYGLVKTAPASTYAGLSNNTYDSVINEIGPWELIGSTVGSSYIDDTVENCTEENNNIHYNYKLITGDLGSQTLPPNGDDYYVSGHLSQPSIVASAEAHDNTPPAPPTDLDGDVIHHDEFYDVHLTWTLSVNDPYYWHGPINTENPLSGPDTVAKITIPRSEWDTPIVITGGAVIPPAPIKRESAKKTEEGLKSSTGISGAVTTGVTGGVISEAYGDKLKEKTGSLKANDSGFTTMQSESISDPSTDGLPSSTLVSPVTDPGKTTYREDPPEAFDVQEYRVVVICSELYDVPAGPAGTEECTIENIPEDEIEDYTFRVYCRDGENDSDLSNLYDPFEPNQVGIPAAGDGSTLVTGGSDAGVSVYEEPNAYPNPFVDTVTIGWPVNEDNGTLKADVVIYDITGRKVKSFSNVSDCYILWNGLDENGTAVPGGVYIANVTVGGETFTYKFTRK